jgi:hypothetical protein
VKVINIGIIIRNDHGDTFPVALNPQMVQVIQNLLTQIPKLQSKLVDPAGKSVTANESIPIIPREVTFDWDAAYQPMDQKEEATLMKALAVKYKELEEQAVSLKGDDPDNKVTQLEKPGMFTDKDNPFNMTLDAKGRSNVDLTEEQVKTAGETNEKYPNPLEGKELGQQDCTVEVEETLGLGAKQNTPGE